ncbi:uncharacterized protein CMC5_025340 [Chondromyces crocatus]|uniref:Diacylglycerol O-acyltransferase n=2 Tax=Chondromyces crocatus TaxID=52 RepID=A0A0K1ECT4_CHOCO|nr:uncharacterized protein CMC5_025340 [Chondromyces crocatus]
MNTPVLLGGIDVFHLMNDRAMRGRGLSGNDCLFVVELGGRLDPDQLQRRLDRAVEVVPELRWRLDVPLFARPRWAYEPQRAAPRVRVHDVDTEAERHVLLETLLATRVGGARVWEIDLVRRPGAGDTLVLRHIHSLVDARGADRLVRWLGSGHADELEDPPLPEERFAHSERALQHLDRNARLDLARTYKAHVFAVGERPIKSLAAVSPPRGAAIHPRVHRLILDADETNAFDRRVRERARLAETSLMLLASARLLDGALRARGHALPHHVLPVPLSLDAKVGARRLLGNHLSMLHFSLDRDDLADEHRAVVHLAEQQRVAIREKLDLAMLAALDLARWLPGFAYGWLRDSPFQGELSSMIFSNPGPMTITSFAGVPVADAYPLPTVVSPPGFQVIFSRFAGRLSASIVHTAGVLDEVEARTLPRALRADLLGEPAPAP